MHSQLELLLSFNLQEEYLHQFPLLSWSRCLFDTLERFQLFYHSRKDTSTVKRNPVSEEKTTAFEFSLFFKWSYCIKINIQRPCYKQNHPKWRGELLWNIIWMAKITSSAINPKELFTVCYNSFLQMRFEIWIQVAIFNY